MVNTVLALLVVLVALTQAKSYLTQQMWSNGKCSGTPMSWDATYSLQNCQPTSCMAVNSSFSLMTTCSDTLPAPPAGIAAWAVYEKVGCQGNVSYSLGFPTGCTAVGFNSFQVDCTQSLLRVTTTLGNTCLGRGSSMTFTPNCEPTGSYGKLIQCPN